jgi:NAD(P)-dependent dehydrogenase (short-subunit alcohol dehydrogenase family)
MDLSGKVAMVTGGASGIGRETSQVLAANGAAVAVADLNVEGGAETVQLIENDGGQGAFVALDVTSEEAWETATSQVIDRFGGLDVLVNGAGIEEVKTIADSSLADFRRINAVNLDGVFLGVKYGMAAMRERGGGSIINISSIAGLRGYMRQAAYCASKGGVRLLTKAAAMEAAHYGYNVRVNSVHPGSIMTPMVDGMISYDNNEERRQKRLQTLTNMHPIGRMGEPRDIADAILFLASDSSSFMTGSEVVVDGGVTAG